MIAKLNSVDEQKELFIKELVNMIKYKDKNFAGFARRIGNSKVYINNVFNRNITFVLEQLFRFYKVYGLSLKVDLYKDNEIVKSFCNKDHDDTRKKLVKFLHKEIKAVDGSLLKFIKRKGLTSCYIYPLFRGDITFKFKRLFSYLEFYDFKIVMSFVED